MTWAATRQRLVFGAAVLLTSALFSGCTVTMGGEANGVGDSEQQGSPAQLPAITLQPFDSGDESLQLASVRGPAVLNYWASWCGPCKREMPVLQEFAERYRGVRMIGIDIEDPHRDKAEQLVADSGVTYDLYVDPKRELHALTPLPPITNLPFVALIDEQGRFVFGQFTEVKSVEQLAELVAEHLGPHYLKVKS